MIVFTVGQASLQKLFRELHVHYPCLMCMTTQQSLYSFTNIMTVFVVTGSDSVKSSDSVTDSDR